VKHIDNLKSLAEIANFILNFSESDPEHGYYIFDSVISSSLLYSWVKFHKKYFYELI